MGYVGRRRLGRLVVHGAVADVLMLCMRERLDGLVRCLKVGVVVLIRETSTTLQHSLGSSRRRTSMTRSKCLLSFSITRL